MHFKYRMPLVWRMMLARNLEAGWEFRDNAKWIRFDGRVWASEAV